jgi:hypothetical protein
LLCLILLTPRTQGRPAVEPKDIFSPDISKANTIQIGALITPEINAEDVSLIESYIVKLKKKTQENKRRLAFSLKGLMEEMGVKIDQDFMPAVGKSVCARFKKMHGATFSKKKITFFYVDDKECLEKLINEEVLKHKVAMRCRPISNEILIQRTNGE